MASYERGYAQVRASRPKLPPVTKWLLIVNAAVFIVDAFVFEPWLGYQLMKRWGAFAMFSAFGEFRIYEFLTFQFLHGNLLHVLFNSIGIFFLGPFVERWWGSRKFLWFYLICGVTGALFFTLLLGLGLIPNSGPETPLIGASAGLFGIVFAVYVIAPAARIRLLIPPIELTMKQFALALGGIAVLTVLGGLVFPESRWFWNSGGEAGHLGGAIMGFLLMKNPWLLGLGERPGSKVIRPKQFRKTEPKLRPRSRIDPRSTSEVDRILDKVSAEGFASLTPEEKKTLEEASRHE